MLIPFNCMITFDTSMTLLTRFLSQNVFVLLLALVNAVITHSPLAYSKAQSAFGFLYHLVAMSHSSILS